MGKNPLGNFEMLNKRPHVKDWNLKMESKIECERNQPFMHYHLSSHYLDKLCYLPTVTMVSFPLP